MNFVIPGAGSGQLPADIQERIEQDVQIFERKFAPYRMFLDADKVAGWVSEYRGAIVALAFLCLRRASEGTAPGVGGPRQ